MSLFTNEDTDAIVEQVSQEPAPVETPTPPPAEPTETPTEEVSEQPVEGEPAPEETPDPRAAINAVAEQYGVDPAALAGFDTPEAATAAIRYQADELARAGLAGTEPLAGSPASPSPVPQPATAAPEGALDLKALGLEDDDPAAAAIRALEQKLNATNETASKLVAQFEQNQQQVQQQSKQQLYNDAEEVVAGFESPEFGKAGNRTTAQSWNVKRLYDMADAVMIGADRAGRPIPSLKARLSQARLLLDQVNTPAVPAAPSTPALPVNRSAVSEMTKPMSMTEPWSENTELLARIRG